MPVSHFKSFLHFECGWEVFVLQNNKNKIKTFSLQEEDDQNDIQPNENDGEIENVRVVVRVRPMDKSEMDTGADNVVKVDKSTRCITVVKPNAPTEPSKIYYFDNVFGEDSTQVRTFLSFLYLFSFYLFSFSQLQTNSH